MPTHGLWPSGYATAAYCLCGAASRAERRGSGQRFADAARIAVNRAVAALHYPVASVAGDLLGLALDEHLAALSEGGTLPLQRFDGAAFRGDFHRAAVDALLAAGDVPAAAPLVPGPDPLLAAVWARARAEWRDG